MLLASFFRSLGHCRPRPPAQRRGGRRALRPSGWPRLFLERLETRVVPGFIAPVSYPTGNAPTSVAVGDFNGDGLLDLAVADYGYVNGNGSGVSVLLGNGDGSFQDAHTYPAGHEPNAVAVADFNRDGKPDLVVANYATDNVSVLLGNGDGSFQAPVSYRAGFFAVSVVVGDFNGDSIPDLAVADAGTSTGYGGGVSVLLGNGDGSFQGPVTYSAGTKPNSVAVGDFNGDGVLDLAVTAQGDNFGRGRGVSVLLGNGDGSFQAPATYSAGSKPNSVAVGDFDGDGSTDLAVIDKASTSTNTGVNVLLGNGDGSFRPAVPYAAGYGPFSVVVGDVNDDGTPDLAVAGDNGVAVLLGSGDGSFQAPITYPAGLYPDSVAVGDFSGGFPDLAVADNGSNDVAILLNDGSWPTSPGERPGAAAARSRAQSSQNHSLASQAVMATARMVPPNALPSANVPTEGARNEPWILPALADSLWAGTAVGQPAHADAASSPLRYALANQGDGQPLLSDRDLLEQPFPPLPGKEP